MGGAGGQVDADDDHADVNRTIALDTDGREIYADKRSWEEPVL